MSQKSNYPPYANFSTSNGQVVGLDYMSNVPVTKLAAMNINANQYSNPEVYNSFASQSNSLMQSRGIMPPAPNQETNFSSYQQHSDYFNPTGPNQSYVSNSVPGYSYQNETDANLPSSNSDYNYSTNDMSNNHLYAYPQSVRQAVPISNNSPVAHSYPPGIQTRQTAYQQQCQIPYNTTSTVPPTMVPNAALPPTYAASGAQQVNYPSQSQSSLNVDTMPSAVEVIKQDRLNFEGQYDTGKLDHIPPLVTTEFVAIDHGTCSPKFIRSSLYKIPTSPDILKNLHIPFVLNISPFAALDPSENVYCNDFGEKGPVRCNRCKAYMSPMMTFIDGGRRFTCKLCNANTDVPEEYFTHLDQNGRRMDCYQRPELCLGSYELLATADYCRNATLPKPPAFIFLIDVSYYSVKSGLLNLFCTYLKDYILPSLPTDSQVHTSSKPLVGFVTYDKVIHFYNLKSDLMKPHTHIVCDFNSDDGTDFVPIIDGFLVNPDEAIDQIAALMENISQTFQATEEKTVLLGPAVEAGMQALKVANRCGKLFVFHTCLPNADTPGKLKHRDDRTVLGTDKEKTLFLASSNYYTKLGESCVEAGVSVDLFLTPSAFMDVSTLAELPKLTGGNLFKYDFFSALNHQEQFLNDIRNAVSKPCAFDAVMRVRTSLGTRTVDFMGNFFMNNTEDVQLACIDVDKSVMVEIKHNDKLSDGDIVSIQVAVLFTSISGQRRLRIHNISFPTSSNMQDIFKLSELDVIMNWMCKQAIRTFQSKTVKDVRDEICSRSAHILATYRRNYGEQSKPAELVLPENLKLLPLYANSLIKCDFMQSDFNNPPDYSKDSATDLVTDERAYMCFLLNGMDVKHTQVFLYPQCLCLTDLKPDQTVLPPATRDSIIKLSRDGVYLMENGVNMYLWIGQEVDSEWLVQVFNCRNVTEISNKNVIPRLNTGLSNALQNVINAIRRNRSRYMKLSVVIQGDQGESAFKKLLVEDRGDRPSSGYVDFLMNVHKDIRNILNY